MQSSELKELAVALTAAQASLNPAAKDATNPHFRNRYATLQSVWDAAREVLAPNGLSVIQTFKETDGQRLDLTTTLLHKSGQFITGTLSMCPQQATPQGIGSAITYARRYSLASVLGIVADEDDDGNEASKPVERHSEAPPRSAPPASSKAPASKPTGNWRAVEVPAFIVKYKGKTIGDMSEQDLAYWSSKYEPKPYRGSITDSDKRFRAALTAASLEMFGPAANKAPAPAEDMSATRGQPAADDSDLPF